MATEPLLITLSTLVVISYGADLLANRVKFPSVLVLLCLGIILNLVTSYFNYGSFNFVKILPTLGTVGLILIVFEGALELDIRRDKLKFIRSALFSSFISLMGTCLAITFILYILTGFSMHRCFVNAIPLSIVSSAIAIPSAVGLGPLKREFIVYESSFSDILGIILFNFAISNSEISIISFTSLGLEITLTALLSIIFCLTLIYLLRRINHKIKFFLIISLLVLFYAIGKYLHLSSLLIVLAFGLFLNNAEKIDIFRFRKYFMYEHFRKDVKQFHQLSAESAFILRTFFFIIFGFIIDFHKIADIDVLFYSLIVLLTIYLFRSLGILAFSAKNSFNDLIFMAPRGLISILLFFNIPTDIRIPKFELGILFVVVLITSILMTVAILSSKKTQ